MNLADVEKQVRNMGPDSQCNVVVSIDTIQEFHAITRSKRFAHLTVVKPYEASDDQNYYFFKYSMTDRPKITITVKSPVVAVKKGIYEPKVRTLTSVEITEAFNAYAEKVMFNRTDIPLKPSNMHTSKLVIEFMGSLRMHTLVQLSQSQKILIFAN